jgi:hypothetical protein
MQKEMHTSTGALKGLALFEMAKANRYPLLAVLRRAAEVANIDDTVRKYEHLIHRTIDQLEKLYFYQQHLDMADLRLETPKRRF